MLATPLERGHLLPVGSGELVAGLVEVAFALNELAVSLFEHVAALVKLLVTLEESTFEGGQFAAAGAGLFLGLALKAELLVLGLEDQFLLASPGLCFDPPGF